MPAKEMLLQLLLKYLQYRGHGPLIQSCQQH